ncbi:beta-1,3-glucan-binding protein-like [Trichogramma pretiosum]|uniref:beta-1,3-glucan-binding protein-like n=1 Tax=Trichogramma pretiosum TaxID=7493 RepID=UPI0006C98177|nr:beta-1,3-glucan-binding protein-like [Trichogramma pretiosum]
MSTIGARKIAKKMEASSDVAAAAAASSRFLWTLVLVLINFTNVNVFSTAQSSTGRLLFEENFDGESLNKSVWKREIKIPLEPDYEFCVFHKHDENLELKRGVLRITPRLFEDIYGEDSIYIGQLRLADCTSTSPRECSQQASSYHVLPPVISAKITTKDQFEFRYGVVEVRAKFPEGDWLYPEMWLEPVYKSYESGSANARIDLGRSRGNALLTKIGDTYKDYGARMVEFGVANGTGNEFHEENVNKLRRNGGAWNKEFHIYKTTWSPKGFSFHVDGQLVGKLLPSENSGWTTYTEEALDKLTTPFDEKFYLSIGLGVGGVRAFPDGTQTRSYVKPWRNINAKAMLFFWQAKTSWFPSWQPNQGAQTALEIDYVRVYSLD